MPTTYVPGQFEYVAGSLCRSAGWIPRLDGLVHVAERVEVLGGEGALLRGRAALVGGLVRADQHRELGRGGPARVGRVGPGGHVPQQVGLLRVGEQVTGRVVDPDPGEQPRV